MRLLKRRLIFLLIIIIAFFLQCTLMKRIALASVSPNLLLIVTASLGFFAGSREGMYTGLVCGIMNDLFFGNILGVYALIYLYIGYLNGYFRNLYYEEGIALPLAFTAVSDLVYGGVIYILFFLLRGRFHFGYYLMHVIIPEAVYTVLIAAPVFLLLRRIYRALDEPMKRSVDSFVS